MRTSNPAQTVEDLVASIAGRCEQAHQTTDGWMACCPAHDDEHPSLSMTPGQNKVLLKCHAGCTFAAIVTALGMKPGDLFLHPRSTDKRVPHPKVYGPIDTVYDYHDSQGVLLHQTVRYRNPKDFSQRHPDPNQPGRFIGNLQGIEPVLYHLPEVLTAVQRGETIYVAEGEKDVDTLRALGLIATCNPMGAGKWHRRYSEALRNAHVILLPDHDEPGLRHMQRVAKELEGTAADIKIVLGLYTDTIGSDISDWLTAGGTREGLEATVSHVPWYHAPLVTNGAAPSLGIALETDEQEMLNAVNGELPTVPLLSLVNDEAFARALLAAMATPEGGAHLLFQPPILARLQRIAQHAPALYQGLILPKARALHVWVPALTEAIAASPKDYDPFVFTDAAAILATAYPPPRWLVSGLIADGLTILGGSPKSGKSYLAYALALAVCRPALWCQHWATEEGPVTFVSLEDDEADSHQRLNELAPGLRLERGRLRFVHGIKSVPAFGAGLIEWVEATLQAHQPRLLIIDPVSYLYVLKKSGGQFEETKDMLFPLRWLGKQYHCAIVCIDHRRKRSRDDVSMFDTLHGSVAKQAVADALLMIERDEKDITMVALVRKGKDQTIHLSLEFDLMTGMATLEHRSQAADLSNYSDLRQKVMATLMELRRPLTIAELVSACEVPDTRPMRNALNQVLMRAQRSHEIEKTTRGCYVWTEGN